MLFNASLGVCRWGDRGGGMEHGWQCYCDGSQKWNVTCTGCRDHRIHLCGGQFYLFQSESKILHVFDWLLSVILER